MIGEYNKLKEKARLSDKECPPLSENMLRTTIVEKLCKLRIQQFRANLNWRSEMTMEALKAQGKSTTVENRGEELKQEFYCFFNCSDAKGKSYANQSYSW